MSRLPRNQILIGDARQVLATLPADSVDCMITSAPYFHLRDYQRAQQIGLESRVDDSVRELLLVCRKLAGVLKGSGSLSLNLGDTYGRRPSGAPPKRASCWPRSVSPWRWWVTAGCCATK